MSHAYINDQSEYCLEIAEGIVIGANAVAVLERERIIALLEAEWWMRPANKARLIALIKGEQK